MHGQCIVDHRIASVQFGCNSITGLCIDTGVRPSLNRYPEIEQFRVNFVHGISHYQLRSYIVSTGIRYGDVS